MVLDTGPWRLVGQLQQWAADTDWVEWLELSGSLGRGAGDEQSDVDAGIGLTEGRHREPLRDQALAAVRGFAEVADHLVQEWGEGHHLVVQYRDGRQLSLVLLPAASRKGLPPGSIPLLDRHGALAQPWQPSVLRASPEQLREWGFLAWWGLTDVAKHAGRGNVWRAITSLNEVRDLAWRLHAADLTVDYPMFGAVSVENAALPAPQGMSATLPRSHQPQDIVAAARSLAAVLDPLTEDLDVHGLRDVALARLG